MKIFTSALDLDQSGIFILILGSLFTLGYRKFCNKGI